MLRAVILCPLEIERRAIARAVEGAFTGGSAQVRRTGPGADAVAAAVHEAAAEAPGLIILAGLAGALKATPLVPRITQVIDFSLGVRWTPPVSPAPEEEAVAIVGQSGIVASPRAKANLHKASGASLVDCECHGFARACDDQGLRWAVIRGVSDGPNVALPESAIDWVNDRGIARPGRVLASVLGRPALLATLFTLRKSSKSALKAVAARVRRLLEEEAVRSGGSDQRARHPVPARRPDPAGVRRRV